MNNMNFMYDNFPYIDNIINLNKGKSACVYATMPNKEIVFEGIIEDTSRDYIIISNPNTGEWNLVLMMYLNYITFTESINFAN